MSFEALPNLPALVPGHNQNAGHNYSAPALMNRLRYFSKIRSGRSLLARSYSIICNIQTLSAQIIICSNKKNYLDAAIII